MRSRVRLPAAATADVDTTTDAPPRVETPSAAPVLSPFKIGRFTVIKEWRRSISGGLAAAACARRAGADASPVAAKAADRSHHGAEAHCAETEPKAAPLKKGKLFLPVMLRRWEPAAQVPEDSPKCSPSASLPTKLTASAPPTLVSGAGTQTLGTGTSRSPDHRRGEQLMADSSWGLPSEVRHTVIEKAKQAIMRLGCATPKLRRSSGGTKSATTADSR